MIRVIINADDLGKNELVNEAIANALAHSVISSSSIMANTDYWSEVHKIISDNPDASFGIHLNLTEGKALTTNRLLLEYGIVDENNVFTNKVRLLNAYPQDLIDAIRQEWDAQIAKVVVDEKISVSHLDGHHHIHAFYPFRDLLSNLADKYAIRRIRNRYSLPMLKENRIRGFASDTLNLLSSIVGFPKDRVQLLLKKKEDKLWKEMYSKRFILCDYFTSYESAIRLINQGGIFPDSCTIELMCHPGHPKYEIEYKMIERFELQRILKNCTLINYNQLSS